REYMERFARDVNHSGTFNSNVISMAASVAAIAELERDGGAVYRQMERIGTALMEGLQELGQRLGLPLHVQGLPTAFHVSFTELTAIRDYRDYAQHCDRELYGRFVLAMLRRGVRLIGRGIWYVSAAHTESHVEQTLQAAEAALQEVATEA
ncbi:hypothetical protein RY27_08455, partial [Litorilinea aerophila]